MSKGDVAIIEDDCLAFGSQFVNNIAANAKDWLVFNRERPNLPFQELNFFHFSFARLSRLPFPLDQ